MGEESKRTYTIRVSAQVAAFIDEAARSRGITPTTLIQSVIGRKFRSPENADRESELAAEGALGPQLEALRKRLDQLERSEITRFDRLRFEIVKTRAALLHSADQSLGRAVVDRIIEASEQTAREYIAGLGGAAGSKP